MLTTRKNSALSLTDAIPQISEANWRSELVKDTRSAETKRAYVRDVRQFFVTMWGVEPSLEMIKQFFALDQRTATHVILDYKARLMDAGLKANTVNRYLCAIKYLVEWGKRLEFCQFVYDSAVIKKEKVKPYRDTTGVDVDTYNQVFDVIDINTPRGKRDYALFLLLWTNVLRRGEIAKLLVGDFDLNSSKLRVFGKGKGVDFEWIDLPAPTAEAMIDWLDCRGKLKPDDPLFIALDFHYCGHQLTGDGVYNIVTRTCARAGIKKRMTPHKIRHSGITDSLEISNGDYRKVQSLSRHADPRTVMIYDDNRKQYQAEISRKLAERVGKRKSS